jgi:hypothetical protein
LRPCGSVVRQPCGKSNRTPRLSPPSSYRATGPHPGKLPRPVLASASRCGSPLEAHPAGWVASIMRSARRTRRVHAGSNRSEPQTNGNADNADPRHSGVASTSPNHGFTKLVPAPSSPTFATQSAISGHQPASIVSESEQSIKCAANHSRNVENASAILIEAWGNSNFISFLYDAPHHCAEKPRS